MIAEKLWESALIAALQGKLTDGVEIIHSAEYLLRESGVEQKAHFDIPFTIPDHWCWVRFGELVDFNIGKTPKRNDSEWWDSGDIPWVSISDMTQGKQILQTKECVTHKAVSKIFRGKIVPKGTLLMSFKLTIGRCSFLGVDAVHNEAIISIFPKPENKTLLARYLSYALPYLSTLGKSKNAIKGATLNKASLSDIPIPVPPYLEQQIIVERLETLRSLIDHLAVLEREREDLDRKLVKDLESILPSFIINQHSAYELPGEYAWENGGIEHSRSSISRRMQRLRRVAVDSDSAWSGSPWPLVSLGSLCVHIASGSTPRGGRAVYQDKGVIFLRSQNVHNDSLRLEGVARISLALHERKKNSHVRPLDVLLNITGASIGRSAVVPQDFEPANINQHILILRLEDSRLSEYVHKILITHPTYQDIIRLQSGSTKEGLSGEKAATLAIPMPPELRRRKLVNLLDSLSESIRVLRSVVSN